MLKMAMAEVGIEEKDQPSAMEEQTEQALEASKDRHLALLYLSNADRKYYKKLHDDLANHF